MIFQAYEARTLLFPGRMAGKSRFAAMMGWKVPSRIRRMSKRRQKKAVPVWLQKHIERELKGFVGKPNTIENRDDIMDSLGYAITSLYRKANPAFKTTRSMHLREIR